MEQSSNYSLYMYTRPLPQRGHVCCIYWLCRLSRLHGSGIHCTRIGLSSSAVRGKQSHKLCCLKNVRKISSQQTAAVQSLWCCPISGSEASAYVQVRHSQLLIYRLVSVSVLLCNCS